MRRAHKKGGAGFSLPKRAGAPPFQPPARPLGRSTPLAGKRPPLILGYGNSLRGDDAIGLHGESAAAREDVQG